MVLPSVLRRAPRSRGCIEGYLGVVWLVVGLR